MIKRVLCIQIKVKYSNNLLLFFPADVSLADPGTDDDLDEECLALPWELFCDWTGDFEDELAVSYKM